MNPARRLIGLDAVRATAILLVVADHFLLFYWGVVGRWSYPLGVLGVEIFFVLSGYLIGGVLLDVIARNHNVPTVGTLSRFWVRRLLRTLPNYLLFLWVGTRSSPVADARRLLPFLTFTQNFFRPSLPFYGVSWSLAIEEWFYLLFPGLILALGFTGWRTRHKFLAAMCILFVLPLALRLLDGPGRAWDDDVRKTVVMRLDALMWGVLVAAVRRYASAAFVRLQTIGVFALGLAMLALLTAALAAKYQPGVPDFTATPGDAWWFPSFNLSVALILPFCVGVQRFPAGLAAVTVRLSLWSYSMYLCHLPVMGFLQKHLPLSRVPLAGTTFLVVVGVSATIYHCFESPILRLRDRWTAEGKRVSPGNPVA